jgi:hypothetical protein
MAALLPEFAFIFAVKVISNILESLFRRSARPTSVAAVNDRPLQAGGLMKKTPKPQCRAEPAEAAAPFKRSKTL